MDSHNIFYTVDGHGTQTSYHLRRRHHHHHHHSNSNHTLPRLSDHFQQSTPATSAMHSNSTGLAPSVFQSNSNRSIDPLSTSSSPSLPQGLPSCNSTPTHSHNHLTSTLSSPVSFDSHSHSSIGSNSNGILCTDVSNRGQTSFISIARNNNARLSKRTLLQGFSSSAAHYPNDSDSNLDLLDSIAKMHPQAALVITDDDMDHAACYCFDRGGGNYTPLVPIDRLPADVLGLLPARVTSDENMIVLPEPRLAGDAATNQTIAKFADLAVTPPTSPHNGGGMIDVVQSRIDDIIASAPSRQNALVLATNTQNHSARSANLNRKNGALVVGGGRREKIYCDKWVHDGVCAFTQQGCKFKHEMPGDRETQQSLGLFHGYPTWWKKKCAEEGMFLDDRHIYMGDGHGYINGDRRLGSAGHGGQHMVESIGNSNASSALASNNWRQRAEAGLRSKSPESYGTATAASPLSTGSSASTGNSRAAWQSRNRTVDGNELPKGHPVARYTAHLPPANFGPIAPPSQTAAGFKNAGNKRRGTAHRNNADHTNTGATAPLAVAKEPNSNLGLDGLPDSLGAGVRSLPVRGSDAADNNASARSEESDYSIIQNLDEMGHASGVKL